MHTGIVVASTIHNLSLATAYGGSIFARTSLYKAVLTGVSNDKERGKVLSNTFTEWNKVNIPAHVAIGVTWAVQRNALNKGYLTSDRTHRLVAIKDMLVGGALLSGAATVIAGEMMKRDFPQGVSISSEGNITGENARKAERYVRFFEVMGAVHRAMLGGSIIMGPVIGASAIRGAQRGLLSRLFGGMSKKR